ncbi:MAG TPA: YafY family protein [Bryobacteraceae bacterium]|nr:YafY family protein [Bryobacteraceae bacterium]
MRSQRLLSILLQLSANHRVTAKDLAGRLEVSERTILRDMDALSGLGIPVVAERGAGGGWKLLEEYQTRLTGLTPEEIQSLFVASPPGLLADLGLRQASDDAWAKLKAALPAHSRPRAEFVHQRILIDPRGWRDASESVSCLPVLLDALWREAPIQFVYERVLCEASERTVDPLGLVARGSTWYLIAKRNDEIRTYRVSRIRDPEVLKARADRPADFNLASYWERSAAEFREKLPQYHATFLATPAAMRWVRYRGWRLQSEEEYDSGFRIRIRFDAEEEAVQFALSLGIDLSVLEPDDLRAHVLRAAGEIVASYSGSATTGPGLRSKSA